MELQNRKKLTEINDNTTYKNCRFDIEHHLKSLHNIQFEDCCFAHNKLIVDEIYNCSFVHCDFDELRTQKVQEVDFRDSNINHVVIYRGEKELMKIHFNRKENIVLLQPHGFYGKQFDIFCQALDLIPKESKHILCDMQFLNYISVHCFYHLQLFIRNRENSDIRFYNVPLFAQNLFLACRLSHKIDHCLNTAPQGKRNNRSSYNNIKQFTYTHRNYCMHATSSPIRKTK